MSGLMQLKPVAFFEGTRVALRTRLGTTRVDVRFKIFKSTHDVERRVSISKFASALQNELPSIRSRLHVKRDVCVAGVVHQKPRFDDLYAN
jgi:hypothetical protein